MSGAERTREERGCLCSVHRDDSGRILSTWTDPSCALHGGQGPRAGRA